jgi:S-DNA-T family DNA segregation ATPase FtsK/SpoIIIE
LKRAASALLSSAVARTLKNSAWNEVFALILLGVGTLLFLALISYTPRDVPSWVWFSHISPANHPAQNFIGPFGAIIAGICYHTIGAAAYLLAAVLLGFGAAKLFHSSLRVTPRIVWIVLFIASGACLLQLQTHYFRGWRLAFNIQGPGGWAGYFLGKTVLLNAMGKVGSVILLSGIYVTTLILMTGLRPIHLIRETVATTRRANAKLHEWRLHRQLRRSDLKGQLEISQKELAKQRRLIEKQLKKKGASVPESTAAFISPEELANRPKPKVVDTTALPSEPVSARRKPSLAELTASKEKPKAPAGLTSRTWNPENYTVPGLDLLDKHDPESRTAADPAELERVQQILIDRKSVV